MIPLYGFLQGDVLGILVIAQADDTIDVLCNRLMQSCRMRVSPREKAILRVDGRVLEPALRLGESELKALDRFDVELVEAAP